LSLPDSNPSPCSAPVRPVDARSPAVRAMIKHAVNAFKARDLEIGICGQAPSDYPDEVPRFLVECGISSMSVTPDTVIEALDVWHEGRNIGSAAVRLLVVAMGDTSQPVTVPRETP